MATIRPRSNAKIQQLLWKSGTRTDTPRLSTSTWSWAPGHQVGPGPCHDASASEPESGMFCTQPAARWTRRPVACLGPEITNRTLESETSTETRMIENLSPVFQKKKNQCERNFTPRSNFSHIMRPRATSHYRHHDWNPRTSRHLAKQRNL